MQDLAKGDLIIYEDENGKIEIEAFLYGETLWLPLNKIAELFEKDKSEYQYQVINNKEEIGKILDLYITKYYNIEDDKQTWFDKIKELAGEMGYAKEVKEFKANPNAYKAHVGDVSTVLRVALTKRTNTPDMYEIMQVLGKDTIKSRFEIAKASL